MRVYLAGAMGGRLGAEVLGERARAKTCLHENNIEIADPAATENIEPHKVIDLRMSYETMRRYVSKDEYAISKCDALLVLTGDRPSVGTSWEEGYAHFRLGIPVVVISPKRATGGLVDFTTVKASAIFETVEEAAEWMAENLGD